MNDETSIDREIYNGLISDRPSLSSFCNANFEEHRTITEGETVTLHFLWPMGNSTSRAIFAISNGKESVVKMVMGVDNISLTINKGPEYYIEILPCMTSNEGIFFAPIAFRFDATSPILRENDIVEEEEGTETDEGVAERIAFSGLISDQPDLESFCLVSIEEPVIVDPVVEPPTTKKGVRIRVRVILEGPLMHGPLRGGPLQ